MFSDNEFLQFLLHHSILDVENHLRPFYFVLLPDTFFAAHICLGELSEFFLFKLPQLIIKLIFML